MSVVGFRSTIFGVEERRGVTDERVDASGRQTIGRPAATGRRYPTIASRDATQTDDSPTERDRSPSNPRTAFSSNSDRDRRRKHPSKR
jgi:hypothetical protein